MGRGHGGTGRSTWRGGGGGGAVDKSQWSPLRQQMDSIPLATRSRGEYVEASDAEMRKQFESYYVITKKDGTQRLQADIRNKYGARDVNEAFNKWKSEERTYRRTEHARSEKIHNFERFLHDHAERIQKSNISRSTYYQYRGTEYRFSDHRYPTGSMTRSNGDGTYSKIDFAVDSHLIDDIKW